MSTAAELLLSDLAARCTPAMVLAVNAWIRAESGGAITGNNPWNLHAGPECPITARDHVLGLDPSQRLVATGGLIGNRYAGPGDRNVGIWDSLAAGVAACARNLLRSDAASVGYDHVVAAARAGDAIGFLDALAASSWSAGHYGGPGPSNRLRALYAEAGGTMGGDPMLRRKAEGWTAGPAGAPYLDAIDGATLGTIAAGTPLSSIGESMDGAWRLVAITTGGEDRWVWIARGSLVPLIQGGDPAFDAAVQELILARAAPAPCADQVAAAVGPLRRRIDAARAALG